MIVDEKPDIEYLVHTGVLGMKWGVRRGQKKIDKLVKNVDKSIKKFDRGSRGVDAGTFRSHSRKSRKLTYKANKRVRRINKYLREVKDEPASNMIRKWKKDPIKVAKVKAYLDLNERQTKKLSELRTSLMDVKLDLL
jgi:uncharacterized protein YoxC